MTVKAVESKPRILRPYSAPGIPEHALRDIGERDCHISRKLFLVLRPEGTVPTSQLQYLHPALNTQLLIGPRKPPLLVLGIETVQIDPGRDIGGALILVLKALFHARQMDQPQHPAPVHHMLLPDGSCRVLDGLLHKLHLLDPVLHQLLLNVQGIEHKVVIRIRNGHLTDIVQRKPQILQKEDLLQSGKILVCIKTCPRISHIRGL